MKTVTAAALKKNCYELLSEVEKTGEPIVVTKNGKPVSKIVAVEEKPKTLFGALKGKGRILGDVVAPIDVEWNAEKE